MEKLYDMRDVLIALSLLASALEKDEAVSEGVKISASRLWVAVDKEIYGKEKEHGSKIG